MRAINYSEARNRLARVLDGVVDDVEPTVITRRGDNEGDRAVVIMPLHTYNSMVETAHVLGGGNRRFLQQSIAELEAGQAKRKSLVTSDGA